MRENFRYSIVNLKEWEGFKDNDPDDPGGETVYGISRHYHPEMWDENGNPPDWPKAEQFYLNLWITSGCDNLPTPIDCLHFDSCVNPGPGASAVFLYQSSEHSDPYCRCVEYLDLRQRYYLKRIRERPTSLKYIAGWMDRCLDFQERFVITSWSMMGK